ncbi:hypothetical protein D9756_006655 [Leucocoprinus leucothites]|uniref:F-box domain-containing protein n=1 Tax=Leucocoprinus leucothites TaxID=201217 RepID=A0A8H5G291_9AGAR|nr:hypothetical protein D9756_006655 [Leucoagaricus leucothites]
MSRLIPCIRCGFRQAAPQPPPEDEVSLLTEEIRQIDETILRLKERKATASVQLNAIRAPISGLPDEILSLIFKSAMEVNDTPSLDTIIALRLRHPTYNSTFSKEQYFSLYVLSAVCSHWRRVAWSTQSLWSSLYLDANSRLLNGLNFALPRLYFRNAGNQPMAVAVDCRRARGAIHATTGSGVEGLGSERQDFRRLLTTLHNLIFLENPHKIAHVRFICAPPEWLPSSSNSFAILKRIELSWLRRGDFLPDRTISLTKLHALREVVIDRVLVDIELPWEQITSLEISNISFEVAVRLLTSCPNLVKYISRSLVHEPPDFPVFWLPASQVTLPHLEIFHWEWQSSPEYANLLSLLNCPALRHLYWMVDECDVVGGYRRLSPVIESFFARLPVAQLHLHLGGFRHFVDDEDVFHLLFYVLNSMRQLKQLSLDEDDLDTDVLSVLATMLHRARQEGNQMLPELEQLSLQSVLPGDIVNSESLVTLVQERQASGMTRLHLSVPVWLRPEHWAPSVRTRLKAMVREGFRLEVFEGGKMVSW